MSRFPQHALIAAIAAAAFLTPGPAEAACISTPTSASVVDPLGDADPFSPDATALEVSVDANCVATLSYSVANRGVMESDGDELRWLLDIDSDTSTGLSSNDSFPGSDYGVIRWSPTNATLARSDTATSMVWGEAVQTDGAFGARLDLTRVIGFGTPTIRVAGFAGWHTTRGAYVVDEVPGRGVTPLTLTVTTADPSVAVTPAPQPQPAPQAVAPIPPAATPPAVVVEKRRCRVPVVRNLKLADARAALAAAGCTIRHVRKRSSRRIKAGRILRASVGTGATVPLGKVDLLVSKGKPRKR